MFSDFEYVFLILLSLKTYLNFTCYIEYLTRGRFPLKMNFNLLPLQFQAPATQLQIITASRLSKEIKMKVFLFVRLFCFLFFSSLSLFCLFAFLPFCNFNVTQSSYSLTLNISIIFIYHYHFQRTYSSERSIILKEHNLHHFLKDIIYYYVP